MNISKGDKFKWHDKVIIEVTRVAIDGSWADIIASGPGGNSWRKRQPLPMPDDFVKVKDE